jgi:hypothetical protein
MKKENRYCLRPKELLRSFSTLRVVAYAEKKSAHGERFDATASLVAVKENINSLFIFVKALYRSSPPSLMPLLW